MNFAPFKKNESNTTGGQWVDTGRKSRQPVSAGKLGMEKCEKWVL
jgi:hypothetical protein